ncbi:MAG TPA: insulinase family protein, partial [Bacteroidales bacterium]|nr:insulinase family protein [Bacteroidales bacterium]
MLDRTIAPPIHDFEPFVLPQPNSVQLLNGIPLKLFINPHLDLIHFIIRVKAGVFFEKQKNVAAFCYSILSECHPSLSANEFDGKLDYFGATLNVSVGFEYVTISFIVPKTHCKYAFSFLSEVLISPSFKEESVKKQKEIKIKNWEYSSLKTDIRANRLMYNAFFGNE